MSKRICSVEDCGRPHYCKGYCTRCYQRAIKAGVHVPQASVPDPVERFWLKVDKGGDCWLWTGAPTAAGYGHFRPLLGGPTVMAHRYAYETTVGPIPTGLTIDHLCRNRICVNPAHLEAVTIGENIRRAVPHRESVRTDRCRRGHELAGANLLSRPGRGCRTCSQMRARERHVALAYPHRRCCWCADLYFPKRKDQRTCSDRCRKRLLGCELRARRTLSDVLRKASA